MTTQAPALSDALRFLARGSDEAAWDTLVIGMGAEVYRTCRRVLNDSALAEDACQETWLQVRELAGRFQPVGDAEAAARGWILAIAANVALHLQRKRRRAFVREERHARNRDREGRGDPGLEARTMEHERMAAVCSALADLPENDRTPIMLHYFSGLEYREVAGVLGCPVGTAKARVSRGMGKLRSRLALLGLIFAAGELSGFLYGADAHAAEAAPSPEQLQHWKALLGSTKRPAMPPMTRKTGVSTMKITTFAVLSVVLAVSITWWAQPGFGAEQDDPNRIASTRADRGQVPANPKPSNGLRIRLSADKPAVAPGETLTLTARLENMTTKPVNVRVGSQDGALGRSVFERGDALRLVAGDGTLVAPLPYDVLDGIGPGVDFVTLAPESASIFTCTLVYGDLRIKRLFANWTHAREGQELWGFTFGRPTKSAPSSREFFLETGPKGKVRLALLHEVSGQPAERLRRNAYRGSLDPKAAYWEGKALSNEIEIEVGSRLATVSGVPVGKPVTASSTNLSKPASVEEMQQAAADLNKAAFKLYEQLVQNEKGNLFFSPYSIVTALSMAHAGARGETASEMEQALAYSLAERQPAGVGALARSLNEAGADRGYRLNVANRLFGQKGYPFEQTFIQDGQTHFGAGLEALDFGQCEATRKHINTWVEDRTDRKIKDLLPPDSIQTLTRLVLVNAIYFKAQWMLPFRKTHTRDAAFRLADGKAVQAPFMNQTAYFNYAELEEGRLQALEMAYRGGELSMIVLLPAQAGGIGALDRLLSAERAGAWLEQLKPQNVRLSLPPFKSEWGGTMNETLKALGMRKAFQPGSADFTGMAKRTGDPLSISLVIHKTFVSVDEDGTEAAAATSVAMLGAGIPKEPKVFRADRPFVYLIRERSTGAILFLGRVMNPVQ